jgi:HAMP domain-containing protein
VNGMVIQLVGSAVAVAAMVAFAAWARIARPTPPLDEAAVRAILDVEYPGHPVDAVWLAADGAGAIARSGDQALAVGRLGDSWVSRDLPWDAALASRIRGGKLRLKFADPAAPRLELAVSGVNPWPPEPPQESFPA